MQPLQPPPRPRVSAPIANALRSFGAVALACALVCVPAFWVLPAVDDWGTLRPPSGAFSGKPFLAQVFWRPLHAALVHFARFAPEAYVPFLHLVTTLGHVASTFLLYRILLRNSARVAVPAAVLFAIFPGGSAAVLSLDSGTQTWSTACGLAALWLLLGDHKSRAWAWAGCALLSAIWKESGIAWFVAAPLLASALPEAQGRRALRRVQVAAALTGLLLYFGLRFGFALDVQLGESSGRYALQANPALWLRNLFQLLGAALTTIDTVALFGLVRHWGVVVLSLAGGLPLLLCALLGLLRRGLKSSALFALVLCTVAAPHLVIGHVSEMYAHPVTAAALLLLASNFTVPTQPRTARWQLLTLLLCMVSAAAVFTHKLERMIHTGLGAQRVGVSLAQELAARPRPALLCSVPHSPSLLAGYSVFDVPAGRASGWGAALLQEWRWVVATEFIVRDSEAACRKEGADAVVVFDDAKSAHLVSPR